MKRRKKGHRKDRQLCAQVARTLATMLGGELGDPVLEGTRVLSVAPMADSSILCVTVTGTQPDECVERLEAASGRLRAAVAEAIHRKRTPELRFRWAPDPAEDAS